MSGATGDRASMYLGLGTCCAAAEPTGTLGPLSNGNSKRSRFEANKDGRLIGWAVLWIPQKKKQFWEPRVESPQKQKRKSFPFSRKRAARFFGQVISRTAKTARPLTKID